MRDSEPVNIDHLLWQISANDDELAYRSLFEQYYASLCLFAKRYIEDKETREDIVQDVFFYIWKKRKSITSTTSARNYLVTCVKNLCLNHLRKQGYIQKYQNDFIENAPIYASESEDIYTLKDLENLLVQALDKLPNEYRIAFMMSRLDGKSTNEIAQALGISTRTVERYRNKALEILKTELKDYLPLLLLLLLN